MSSAKPGAVELAVGDARGDEDAVGAQLAAAAELDEAPRALDAQPHGVLHRQQLGAEAAGLVGRAAGEVRAGQAGGEAEVVLDEARLAGLAARRLALDHDGPQSLGCAVDGGAEAGGAAADDDEVVVVLRRLARDAEALGELEDRRALEDRAVLEQRDRQAVVVDARDAQQLARLAVALDVQPARRHAVAGEEVAQVVRVLREAVPDDAHAARLERRPRLPGRQEILDDREELLLGRVPRLEEVVVQRDLVDRRDRCLGVGVGGEQHALGVGHELARLDEERRAGHRGHPLVGDEHRDAVAAREHLAQEVERLRAGRRPEDPEALAEAAAQVAADGGEHGGLVVDGEDRRAPLGGGAPGGRCARRRPRS